MVRDRIVVREAIYFDTNREVIRKDSTRLLDGIAEVIKRHPELIKIRVEGHTDNIGKPSDNLMLSRRRAAAVRSYLVDRGVDGDRLIAEGFGGEQPIASNDHEEGRARNRRVAFTILERDGDDVVSESGGAR